MKVIARLTAALGLCVSLAIAAPAPGLAQNAGPAVDAAQALAAAADALAAARGARDRVSALTQTIRAYEDGLAAMRIELRRAALREAEIRADFDRDAERLSALLGALQSMGTSPETLILLHPSGPVDTVRAGMILSEITPAIEADVAALQSQLTELATLRALQQSASSTLQAGLDGAQEARVALSKAISDRTPAPDRSSTEALALQALLNSAETLQGFASGLALEPGPDDADRGFAAQRGQLPLPVEGTVIGGFNDADAAGVRRPGLLIAARPRALVTAPWPATIRYLGPLLDYGNVIIIEPDAGYLLIIAGLKEVYGSIGDVARAGAPLGQMGGTMPVAQEILIDAVNGGGQDRTETLYIELREEQTPVDPQDWFAGVAK
ncbi:MAG: peptidoglycan DD-metalloendopeptidase family protein [Rhodobacteraceae bacterium]|nr:peptidoglycan DD-metalloendopeptidase family protein [Paracoccaceae bacterium]